jgi:hypothetical protein
MRSLLLAGALCAVVQAAAAQAILPDPTLTPGSVRTTNLGEICSEGTRQLSHRHDDMAIMAEYGLAPESRPEFEINHLVPLELGGSDDLSNLWPQPRPSIEPEWNAERKHELESALHVLVCSGELDIEATQKALIEDWTKVWRRYVS